LRAVELLLSDNLTKAKEIAADVNGDNNERKNFDTEITETALIMLESEENFSTKKSTVLYNENWHKGVIGIVASRMIEKYYRPTIMLTLSNGKVVGSARSVRNFDVHEALSQCSDLLEQFGGHTMAAGLTMKPEKVTEFKIKFEKVVSSTIHQNSLIALEEADLEINFNEISDKFIRICLQMAPHGPGNQQPTFISKNVVVKGNYTEMKNNSFRFEVYQPIAPEKVFQTVVFNKPELKRLLEERTPFHILYSIDINSFNNKNTVQLRIKDFKSCHERI
jgi:single-stranded-DNA-specific exonuclease